jgi:hypothetical protein
VLSDILGSRIVPSWFHQVFAQKWVPALYFTPGLLICIVYLLWLVKLLADGPFEELVLEVCYIVGPLNLSITFPVIVFVTVLHGFTPRIGVWFMNVRSILSPSPMITNSLLQGLSVFKIVILLFVVVAGERICIIVNILRVISDYDTSGWAVLAGNTSVQDPHANFRNSFAGSSHSGNDVSPVTAL